MTKIRLLILMAGITLGIAPLHASVIFQFDELGTFSYSTDNGSTFNSLPNGTLAPDITGSGIASNVLYYDLTQLLNSFVLLNGDVPIAGFKGGIAGDLRFTDTQGSLSGSETCVVGTESCYLIYYAFDNNGYPADVGPISTSFLTTQTPGAAQDATGKFAYTAGVLTYDGTLTLVPEPATIALSLFGIGGLALLGLRQKASKR
jgi:hypothetical protein